MISADFIPIAISITAVAIVITVCTITLLIIIVIVYSRRYPKEHTVTNYNTANGPSQVEAEASTGDMYNMQISMYDEIRLSYLNEDNSQPYNQQLQNESSQMNQQDHHSFRSDMISTPQYDSAEPATVQYAVVGTTGAPRIPQKSKALQEYLSSKN